jgi:hypothetical protein
MKMHTKPNTRSRVEDAPDVSALDQPNSLMKESKKTPKVAKVPQMESITINAAPTTIYPSREGA